jgi:hypothetical protein
LEEPTASIIVVNLLFLSLPVPLFMTIYHQQKQGLQNY